MAHRVSLRGGVGASPEDTDSDSERDEAATRSPPHAVRPQPGAAVTPGPPSGNIVPPPSPTYVVTRSERVALTMAEMQGGLSSAHERPASSASADELLTRHLATLRSRRGSSNAMAADNDAPHADSSLHEAAQTLDMSPLERSVFALRS